MNIDENTHNEQKQKLIDALSLERDRFSSRGQDITDHNLAINYLKTGERPKYYEDYDLLSGCIDDYNQMLSDYLANK